MYFHFHLLLLVMYFPLLLPVMYVVTSEPDWAGHKMYFPLLLLVMYVVTLEPDWAGHKIYFPLLLLVMYVVTSEPNWARRKINMTYKELFHFIVLFTCRECQKTHLNRYMNDRMWFKLHVMSVERFHCYVQYSRSVKCRKCWKIIIFFFQCMQPLCISVREQRPLAPPN